MKVKNNYYYSDCDDDCDYYYDYYNYYENHHFKLLLSLLSYERFLVLFFVS